ncbi:MAG: TolC family protein, partial [Bacteroidales bacterium]|nr:TolC family protein [Bacteroidales bacterium]
MEYSAAVEKLPQVSSLPDPELQAGFFFRPMELLGGNEVADIRLMQMFPWFGTLKAAKDEASKMAAAKYEKFRDAKNELYMNVKTSYYKVYRTKKEIEIAEKNLAILHTLEQLVLVKFRATGMSTSVGAGSSIDSGAEMFSANLSATGSNSIMKQNS